MTILSIVLFAGFNPTLFGPGAVPAPMSIQTDDTLTTIMETGYLNGADTTFGITFQNNLQIALVSSSDSTPAWLAIQIDGESNVNLVTPTAI